MYQLIGCSFLLLLVSACFCRNIDVDDDSNFGIFGGTQINITEVPFMAIYRPKLKFLPWWCGAAIVNEQFLVTAGHCVLPAMHSRISVGTDNVKGGTDYEIEKVLKHPKFVQNETYVDYDIAVIKLKKHLTFGDKIQPIKMADSSMILKDGDMLQTIGFGQKEDWNPSDRLLSVKLPYINEKKCKEMYKNWEMHVTDRMICAGGDAGKGSCKGDSGSPIFYKHQGKDFLHGVTSWGKPCALKGYPTVYSSVPSMRDFIDKVIKNHS